MMITMTAAISLYISLSLLAMLIIYGACLAAARADRVDSTNRHRSPLDAHPEESMTVEPSQLNKG